MPSKLHYKLCCNPNTLDNKSDILGNMRNGEFKLLFNNGLYNDIHFDSTYQSLTETQKRTTWRDGTNNIYNFVDHNDNTVGHQEELSVLKQNVLVLRFDPSHNIHANDIKHLEFIARRGFQQRLVRGLVQVELCDGNDTPMLRFMTNPVNEHVKRLKSIKIHNDTTITGTPNLSDKVVAFNHSNSYDDLLDDTGDVLDISYNYNDIHTSSVGSTG